MKCLISSEDGDVVDGGIYSQYHVITNDGFVVTVKCQGSSCSAAVLQVAGVPTAVSLGEAGTSASGLHS